MSNAKDTHDRARNRARQIKLVLLDVDGVMTDGTIFLFPAPAGAQQPLRQHTETRAGDGGFAIASDAVIEAKGFHAHDGTAMSLAHNAGLKIGIITKRISETVRLRARDLKLDYVYQGAHDKLSVLQEILEKQGIRAEEVAYVGDDIIDLPVMRAVGLAIAVANAREDVKDESHVITDHRGGEGAVRDAIEFILKAQGKYEAAIAEYIQQRTPSPREG
ncbi:MAG: HAD hydrolase family protein [Terriglobia bacterium]|jgi:3-deoxy-D-manno-octulosonate 8-phosphate phosphatase (KDO 8-P phosphatase)|nr:HAD hydrolase family protein [Terriglobia bacterium]